MAFFIEDGTGRGFKTEVNSENKLRTYSVVENEMAHVSERYGESFVFSTGFVDWGADVNTIWLRNDSTTKRLSIERMTVAPAASCQFEVYVGKDSTVGGTEIIGTNMSRGSGKIANATCRHSNTNVDAGAGMTLLGGGGAIGMATTPISLDGALLLSYLDEVAMNILTDVGVTCVNIIGYYHD